MLIFTEPRSYDIDLVPLHEVYPQQDEVYVHNISLQVSPIRI
jgi:hypothetical protein